MNRDKLALHELWGTGTTGGRVTEGTGLTVTRMLSGPLGGDAQLGAMIAEGRLDALIFFQDPLTAMPHDVDIKSLTRLATLYNILFATQPQDCRCCARRCFDRLVKAERFL